jgi:amino-acid N-acetyltransferase
LEEEPAGELFLPKMDIRRLKEQVETIREAFGYVDRFRGETFVLKIDDALFDHPFFPILIRDVVLLHRMGIRIVLVPGARKRINEILTQYDITCRTVGGVRVSTAEAMPFIRMAAFDVSNRIMTLLAENGANAVIGNWVRARGIGVVDGVNFGDSGVVAKLKIDTIRNALADNLVPIFPTIGWSLTGKPYNVSSNELASTVSRRLTASKLFFLTEHAGVFADHYKLPFEAPGTEIISQMTVQEAARLVAANASGHDDDVLEMVGLACDACGEGVRRVHLVDGRLEGVLLKEIFSNLGVGTMIHANRLENIRPMRHADIPEALRIMQSQVEKGVLVARSALELEESLQHYVVYEMDDTVHGCGALMPLAARSAELGAIAVDEPYAELGIGKRIVEYLLVRARSLELKRVIALTTRAADWFDHLGFAPGSLDDLPAQKRKLYNHSRNSQILVYSLGRRATARQPRVE